MVVGRYHEKEEWNALRSQIVTLENLISQNVTSNWFLSVFVESKKFLRSKRKFLGEFLVDSGKSLYICNLLGNSQTKRYGIA